MDPRMNRIALVEDHERLADLIRQAMAGAGIAVDAFSDIESAWLALRDIPYGALVIDRGCRTATACSWCGGCARATRPCPA